MHDHDHGYAGSGNLRTAFILNFSFTLVEIIGGLWTGSVAILADAVHDLGDSISLGAAWLFEKLAGRSPDSTFTFGYGRFSLLGALLNALVLLVGSVLVLIRAVPRIFAPETPNANGMLALAVLGVLVNGIAVLRMRSSHSLNERMAMWHLLEDALGWIAVLVISVLLKFVGWPVLDPLLSVIITLVVLVNVGKALVKVMRVFLQAVPEGVAVEDVRQAISAVPGVVETHHIHLWTLEGERHMVTAHVVVDKDATLCETAVLKETIREALARKDIECSTLEFEQCGEVCEKNDSFDT